MSPLSLILFEIVFFAILLIIVVYEINSHASNIKGYYGEKRVIEILNQLPKDHYRILNNVLLRKRNGETTQIDHIVISNYGIFVIETKNYKGLITGNEYAPQWTQHMYNKQKYEFMNPIRQNYGHIKTLEEVLLLDMSSFISIIVFSDNANLNINAKKTPVINNNELETTMRSYKKIKLNGGQVRDIEEKLKKLNICTAVTMRQHVKNIKKKQRKHSA